MTAIAWTCDTCHEPTNGRGAISISYDDIHRADAVRGAVVRGSAEADVAALSPEDALGRPSLGLWKVECNTCAGECIGAYWIDLDQMCTDAQIAEWTDHLSAKTWFAGTNWYALMDMPSPARTPLRVVR